MEKPSIRKIVFWNLLIVLVALFVSALANPAHAACNPGMLYLQKGQTAPCDGFLIDETTEEYFNELYENNQLYLEQLDLMGQLLQLSHEKYFLTNERLTQCEKTMKAIQQQQNVKRTKNTAIAVGAGVVLGILINGFR
jgi:hypothetical protein